ncbi:MAG: hypothetical protein ABI456_02765 [Ktedonobacteraceae bacterium]
MHQLNARVEGCQDREENDSEIIDLLSSLYYRKAGQASDFLFLLEYPSNAVLEALADLLGIYKEREAKQLLQEVNIRRGREGAGMSDEKTD